MSKKQTENRYTPANYKQNATSGKSGAATHSILAKKVWTIVAISLALIIAVTGSLVYALYEPEIPTTTPYNSVTPATSDLTIPNSNFKLVYADGQNIQYPKKANYWTIREDVELPYVSMGVLNTSDWDNVNADLDAKGVSVGLVNPLYPSYNAADGFDEDKANIYMISKKQTAQSSPVSVTSSSFTIERGSYPKITVWVKDAGITGNGLYIAVTSVESPTTESQYKVVYTIQSSTDIVSENNGWKEYCFYIEGNKTSAETVYLQMGLGRSVSGGDTTTGYGTVLFAGIEIENKSSALYKSHIQTKLDETKNYLSYSFDDDSAEKTLVDWSEGRNKESASEAYDTITYADYRTLAESQSGSSEVMPFDGADDDTMYRLDNTGNTRVAFARFSVNPPSINKSYRLSLWVRTYNVTKSSGACIYLRAYNNDVYSSANSAQFGPIQTDSDIIQSTYNGWAEYNFYIMASETDIYDMELVVTLGLSAGSENYVPVTGTIYLTEILLHEIDHTDYTSAATGDTVKKVSLKSTVDTESLIRNGSFNQVKTSAAGIEFPIDVSNWTEMYAGQRSIVEEFDIDNVAPNRSRDIHPTDYSSIGGMIYKAMGTALETFGIYGDDFYDGDDDAASVLMIHNRQATAHGYRSASISLSANSYYRISVLAKGIGTALPSIYLTDGARVVYACFEGDINGDYTSDEFKNIDKEIDASGYTRYYFYVATGETAKTVYLELWLGLRGATAESGYATGTVLFDQAECYALSDTSETENGESKEYIDLFEGDTPFASTTADIKNVYTSEQTVTASAQNLSILDYRFNESSETKDLQRVLDFAKTQESVSDELTTMIDTFNNKYYENLTEGTYYIVKEGNTDTVRDLRVHINTLINGEQSTETPTDTDNTEPVDWLVISSLVVTVVMLVAIIAIIFRKFIKLRKKAPEVENKYVG